MRMTFICQFLRRCFVAFFVCAMWMGCQSDKQPSLFSLLPSSHTGIHFSNDIRDNDSSTSFINEFGYMGGGVGIGDFNNDGLKDIFFTGNQGSCRLYINKGNLQFEDITDQAELQTNVWATGVSVVDINNDGYDDVYVSCFGKNLLEKAPNLLFINQHNLHFTEEAAAYGLADSGYSSQAVFFDYDRDGDLDMYLANYQFNSTNTSANNIISIDTSGASAGNDRLYQNEGWDASKGHPVFTDVSMTAGIKEDGYGLGVAVTDINNDGWPDVYVANDFISNDRLWLNNKNGTFTNVIAAALKHQSYSSMGVDAADMNNDGLSDIVTLDMLPEWNERRKTSLSFMNYDRYRAERFKGYEPEFMRNMLQLNNGNRPTGNNAIPFFSEIGQMAGIAATDWSWSVLIADFDLDGWKDMHITNGVGRDFINADFLEYSSQIATSNLTKKEQEEAIRNKLVSLEHVPLPNYLYINKGDLHFTNASKNAGIDKASMSNGAAYADLDNDGDIDLIVNNINEEAFLFANNSISPTSTTPVHYLKIKLKGDTANVHAIGTKLTVFQPNKQQVWEQSPVRGYFSSVDMDAIFGLGDQAIDSIVIQWSNGKQQSMLHPAIDTSITIDQAMADRMPPAVQEATTAFFKALPVAGLQDYTHIEYDYNDFGNQRMLPQKFSQLGPRIASADVNNDGLPDVFIAGANGFDGSLFIQTSTGGFQQTMIACKGPADQTACLFFDADNDHDADLLVTYGDIQTPSQTPGHQPRLFLNDGKGNFTEHLQAIPADVTTIAGAVCAADYDADGDQDIFIGGRVADQYPQIPRSFLLRNDGGKFTDVTASVCPELQEAGMITGAAWTDYDKDGRPDLVLAGNWMPLRFFKNTAPRFTETTDKIGLPHNAGMWRSLVATDYDQDGDMDLMAGNLGTNCIYDASEDKPMEMYANDLDGNGNIDPLMFYYIPVKDGSKKRFPAITRNQFSEQVPLIKKKFLLAKDYATAGFDEIYASLSKKDLLEFTCEETRTCWFENLGNGQFKKHVLPIAAQLSPVNAIVCADINGDGINDLVLAGNEYQADVITGRYDASYGCVLLGTKDHSFTSLPYQHSGLIVDGDVKDLVLLQTKDADRQLLIAAINNEKLQTFLWTAPPKK